MREIIALSGAKVVVSPRGEYAEGTTNRIVTITGTPTAAQTAHLFITQRLHVSVAALSLDQPAQWLTGPVAVAVAVVTDPSQPPSSQADGPCPSAKVIDERVVRPPIPTRRPPLFSLCAVHCVLSFRFGILL